MNLVEEMADSAQRFLEAAGGDKDFEGVTGFLSPTDLFLYQFDSGALVGCIVAKRDQVGDLITFLQKAIAPRPEPMKTKRQGPRS